MDDACTVGVDVGNDHFQHPARAVGAYQQSHVLVEFAGPNRMADGMAHVFVADSVLAGPIPHLHSDNLSCHTARGNGVDKDHLAGWQVESGCFNPISH